MAQSNILDTAENCRYCLMCRHLCPVGNETNNETLSPHGWGQMIAMERRGVMTWNSGSVDDLYKCADCGNCESHCVTDQPLPDAIAAARALIVERGEAPESVRELSGKLDSGSSLFNGPAPEKPSGKGSTALFIGDEADHFAPGTVEAILNVLKAAGVDPVIIGRGRNDGFIPSGLGLRDHAVRLAEATAGDLASTGAKRLLAITPGAWFTFSRIYPERLGVELGSGISVAEVIPLLEESAESGILKLKKRSVKKRFAYVDPVHSVRVRSRYDSPRKLMDRLLEGERVELFWRKERSGANGHTGLQFTHPELADRLTRNRLEDALDAGADVLYTEDPGTFAHLGKLAGEYGLEVRNLYLTLAEQL